MFEQHSEWWDVLCNIQTGKVTVNPAIAATFPCTSVSDADTDLFDDVAFFTIMNFKNIPGGLLYECALRRRQD